MSDNASTGFTSAADFRTFLLAGRAVFTVQSRRTGAHFTFKVSGSKKYPGSYFVDKIVGGEPAKMGMIKSFSLGLGVRPTSQSEVAPGDPSVVAFNWLVGKLAKDVIPAGALVQHEGKCGRCSRALTHPQSLRSGLGPECSGKGYSCEKIAA